MSRMSPSIWPIGISQDDSLASINIVCTMQLIFGEDFAIIHEPDISTFINYTLMKYDDSALNTINKRSGMGKSCCSTWDKRTSYKLIRKSRPDILDINNPQV